MQKYNQIVVKKSKIQHITCVIHPTEFGDYDVIAIGHLSYLIELAKQTASYSHLIRKSKFGGIPILLLDTYDTLKNANDNVRDIKKITNNYKDIYESSHRREPTRARI